MPEILCRKCSKKSKSLQGWKGHMSGAHGGYSDEELQEVTGKPEDDLKQRMTALSGTIGENAADKKDESVKVEQPPPIPEGKRIKATPKKLKKILGDIPAQILRAQGIELDTDDTEAMEEAAEFLAGIFGVEFAVPESKYLIQSRFLAIVWVASVTMLVWLKHRTPTIWAMFSSDKAKDNVEQNNRDSGTKG